MILTSFCLTTLILFLSMFTISNTQENINKSNQALEYIEEQYNREENDIEDSKDLKDLKEEILFVFEIFRHGARTPSKLIVDEKTSPPTKKDIIDGDWSDFSFEKGLTKSGLRQHYILGLEIRNQYDSLLTNKFKPGDIKVLTSSNTRTVESYLAHQQGIFSKYDNEKLTDKQKERAFPPGTVSDSIKKLAESTDSPIGSNYRSVLAYHILPQENHFLKFGKYCYSYKNSTNDVYDQYRFTSLKKIMNGYPKIIEKLGVQVIEQKETNTALMFDVIEKLEEVKDALIAESFQRNYAEDIFSSKDEESQFISDIGKWSNEDTYYKTIKYNYNYNSRILTSRLFDLLINTYIKNRISMDIKGERKYNNANPKLLIFSMHHSEMIHVMGMLDAAFKSGIIDIPYASSYTFELIKVNDNNSNNANNLNSFYNNNKENDDNDTKQEIQSRFLASNDKSSYKIRIRFNFIEKFLGSFEVFNSKISDLIIDNDVIDDYCHFNSPYNKLFYQIWIAVVFVFIIIMLVYLISIIVINRKINNKNKNKIINDVSKESVNNF